MVLGSIAWSRSKLVIRLWLDEGWMQLTELKMVGILKHLETSWNILKPADSARFFDFLIRYTKAEHLEGFKCDKSRAQIDNPRGYEVHNVPQCTRWIINWFDHSIPSLNLGRGANKKTARREPSSAVGRTPLWFTSIVDRTAVRAVHKLRSGAWHEPGHQSFWQDQSEAEVLSMVIWPFADCSLII